MENYKKTKLIDATSFIATIKAKQFYNIDTESCKNLILASRKLKGKRIIHITASRIKKVNGSYVIGGGGLSEILKNQIPLENLLGLESRLFIISAPKKFYKISKKIFDLLLQKKTTLTQEDKNFYRNIGKKFAYSIYSQCAKKYHADIIVVHDFHGLPILPELKKRENVILQWHIDFPSRRTKIVQFLEQWISQCRIVVVSNDEMRIKLKRINPKIKLISPAINPLGVKNRKISKNKAALILDKFGINYAKPLITQVGRFSSQKRPLEAIAVYSSVKKNIPDLQLVLAGLFNLKDDVDTKETLLKVKECTRQDSDIFVFSSLSQTRGVSNELLINALYTLSDVIINMSTKEGFGLTITEAMFKGKVVVANKTLGSLLQIKNNENGILVSTTQQAVESVTKILQSKTTKNRLGRLAHQSVKRNFLITRYILDVVNLYSKIDD